MSLRMPSTLTDRHVSDYLDIMNALDQYSENFPDSMSLARCQVLDLIHL
jgi:hypothetical protein